MIKLNCIICSIGLCLVGCNSDNNQGPDHGVAGNGEIQNRFKSDSLKNLDLIREAKWRIYCDNIDKEMEMNPLYELDSGLSMASLDVHVKNITNSGDTIFFDFCYSFGNQFLCDSFDVIGPCHLDRIGFDKNERSPIYFSTTCNFIYSNSDFRRGAIDPDQPEVIEYINKNQGKINSWFLQEAKRRGVIKKI